MARRRLQVLVAHEAIMVTARCRTAVSATLPWDAVRLAAARAVNKAWSQVIVKSVSLRRKRKSSKLKLAVE